MLAGLVALPRAFATCKFEISSDSHNYKPMHQILFVYVLEKGPIIFYFLVDNMSVSRETNVLTVCHQKDVLLVNVEEFST